MEEVRCRRREWRRRIEPVLQTNVCFCRHTYTYTTQATCWQQEVWQDLETREEEAREERGPPFGIDLFKYFASSAFSGFADQPGGFFAVFRELFDQLQGLQAQACAEMKKGDPFLPSFGNADSNMEVGGSFLFVWSRNVRPSA